MSVKHKLVFIIERLLPVILVFIILAILVVPITLHFTKKQEQSNHNNITELERSFVAQNRTNETYNCSKDFYFSVEYGYCRALCSQWTHYGSREAVLVMVAVTSGFGLFICALTFIIAGFRHKLMFHFPVVFVLYATIAYSVRGIILFTSSVANKQMYCDTDDDFFSSSDHPTTYCIITGIIHQYTSLSATYWWFAWASVTFLKLIFPLRSRSVQIQGRCCYIHAILALIGIFMPTIGIIIASSIETQPYAFDDIPPTVCIAKIHFYSTTFPDIIMTSIYSVMVIITIIIIHKHNSCSLGFTPTENKLIFILILNIFLKFSMLIILAIHTLVIDEVIKSFTEYFTCEAAGRSEEETCDSLVNIGPLLGLKALNIITSGLFPLGPLFYVINWSTVKRIVSVSKSSKTSSVSVGNNS